MFSLYQSINQEPIEALSGDDILDLDQHSKLHVLSGGTKVVQHSPPQKMSTGLKGTVNEWIDLLTNNTV